VYFDYWQPHTFTEDCSRLGWLVQANFQLILEPCCYRLSSVLSLHYLT